MPANSQLLAPGPGSRLPTSSQLSAGSSLPADLLEQASRRLGIMCLVIAGLWVANYAVWHFVQAPPTKMPDTAILRLFDRLGVVGVTLSLALYWYTRKPGRNPRILLNLGLAYELQVCLSAGVLDWAYNAPMGVSWIAIVILLFAAIIPSPPRKTFAVALLAASMDPLGALIWSAQGQEIPGGAGFVFLNAVPNYLCAAIAPLISHIITGLGREVKKAREMGSYVLVDRIGAGGMGEVWQASHRFLARPAAVKLIKPDVLGALTREQSDVLVQRFRREARAAAMLRSPHSIHLYDFGVAGDGTFYYVMELLNGLDLQTLVERYGPLPPARAIFLLQQACESLAEAHDRGLIHRDIKPANIQVCRVGHYADWVKVLDFGLVKAQGGREQETGLTAPNMTTGTPAYLSPESALGEPVDRRTDIYALGCVAYWILTGRNVFTGDSTVQIVARHVSSVPTPPSRHSGFDVPAALDQVVLACLEKEPGNRPGTARELCDRLGRCDAGQWTRDDARIWWETRMEPEEEVALV
jgi:serine/threonine-protein kinase